MFQFIQELIIHKNFFLGSISFNEVIKAEKDFYQILRDYWYQDNYLTAKWWLLIFLSIVPPIVWWKHLDKKRVTEITAFGLFFGVAAIILDTIGSNAMIWTYPVRLSPYLYPQVYPYDVGCVIIPFMLVYQRWGKQFKKYILSTIVLSFFLAFVAEPIMEWLGIYKGITWKHLYSFPIYWLLGIICWGILKKFKNLEQRN
ncbi:MAG TPA: CBO0543 family protein [Pseudoneobacillus sp.]|nr:CBO0543 family protein [Pseudoneobacillus sp.]